MPRARERPAQGYDFGHMARQARSAPSRGHGWGGLLALAVAGCSTSNDAEVPRSDRHAARPEVSAAGPHLPRLDDAPRFREIAREVGLEFEQWDRSGPRACSFQLPMPCTANAMSGGVAVGDPDADGDPDVYATSLDGGGQLFVNRAGRFHAAPTKDLGLGRELHGNGAAWGDLDADGDLDLIVTTIGERRYYAYLARGDGTFEERGEATGLALADDLPHSGFGIALGDYDRDGYLDVYLAEWRGAADRDWNARSNARLLHNRGAGEPGVFDDVTVAAGITSYALDDGVYSFAPAFVDLDDDGLVDLALTSDFGTSRLYWNRGDGTFEDGTAAAGVGTDQNGMGAAFADFDGDGRLDWFVSAVKDSGYEGSGWGSSGNRWYRALGARRFEDATDRGALRDGGWGWGAAALDFDQDGDVDLALTNGMVWDAPPEADRFEQDPPRLWRNEAGTFADVARAIGFDDVGPGKGLATLDFDGDGDLDLLTSVNGGRLLLHRNDASHGGFLKVVPVDRGGRLFAGARAWLTRTPGEPAQLRELELGTRFLGQSEAVLHFGLGDLRRPLHELRVEFPGRSRAVVLRGLGRDQTVRVVAPD